MSPWPDSRRHARRFVAITGDRPKPGDNELTETAMDIHLEIPEEYARYLAPDATGVARAALEALAADAVRSGKLTPFQARHLLGLRSRYEMDGFLKAHGVFLDVTLADVRRDSDTALAMSR